MAALANYDGVQGDSFLLSPTWPSSPTTVMVPYWLPVIAALSPYIAHSPSLPCIAS